MRIVGQESVADMFGVAPKTIVEWQEQGMPIALRGSPGIPSEYEAEACINWLVDREVKKVQIEKPQDRLARAQAEKIEMENAERRGLLIAAEQLEPKLRSVMVGMRNYLRNQSAQVAREVAGKSPQEIEDALGTTFDGFLERFARWREIDVIDEDLDEE